MGPIFQDRSDAGRFLARRLAHHTNDPSVVVLALPRGGRLGARRLPLRLGLPPGLLFGFGCLGSAGVRRGGLSGAGGAIGGDAHRIADMQPQRPRAPFEHLPRQQGTQDGGGGALGVRMTDREDRDLAVGMNADDGAFVAAVLPAPCREVMAGAGARLVEEGGEAEVYRLSERQAQAILDLRLQRLTQLERTKITDELKELGDRIRELLHILRSRQRLLEVLKEELIAVKARFANPRRTTLEESEDYEFDIEDLIADEDLVVSVSRDGYVKTVALDTYRRQGRGGRGVRGAALKEGDIVEHLITTTAHAYLLLFSSSGRVYRVKAHEIPKRDRTSRGTAVVNVVPMRSEDRVAAVIDTRDYESYRYLLIATKPGMARQTLFSEYDSSRREGIIALNLKEGDEVVFRVEGNRAVLARTPDFLALAGTVRVPAAKRNVAWDEVIRRTRSDRAATRR